MARSLKTSSIFFFSNEIATTSTIRTPARRISVYTSRSACSILSTHMSALSFIRFQFLHPSTVSHPHSFLPTIFCPLFLKTTPHLACALENRNGAVGAVSFFPFAPRSATENKAWTGSVYWQRCQVSSTICNRSSPVYWFNIQYGLWVRCITDYIGAHSSMHAHVLRTI